MCFDGGLLWVIVGLNLAMSRNESRANVILPPHVSTNNPRDASASDSYDPAAERPHSSGNSTVITLTIVRVIPTRIANSPRMA